MKIHKRTDVSCICDFVHVNSEKYVYDLRNEKSKQSDTKDYYDVAWVATSDRVRVIEQRAPHKDILEPRKPVRHSQTGSIANKIETDTSVNSTNKTKKMKIQKVLTSSRNLKFSEFDFSSLEVDGYKRTTTLRAKDFHSRLVG